MTVTNASLSAAARDYFRLLMELDELEAKGLGESDEAEWIREQMDRPWYKMSGEEQQLLRRLSADLNDLVPGRPAFDQMSPNELAEYRGRMREALPPFAPRQRELASLALRGKHPAGVGITDGMIRYLQAQVWISEGLPVAAIRFLREAARLDTRYTVFLMNVLRDVGRLQEAVVYANQLLQQPGVDPHSVYFACVTLYDRIRHADPPDVPELRRIVDGLQVAWAAVRSDRQHEQSLPGTASTVGDTLALCLDQLGDKKAAVAVCEEIVRLAPQDANGWATYGIIALRSNPAKAVQCFEKAIRLQAGFAWPYVLYAEAVVESEPLKAVRVCNLALNSLRDIPAKAQAALYHLRGVGLAKAGQPPRHVLDDFDKALDYDPDNEIIRQNREIVASVLAGATQAKPFTTSAVSPRVVEQIRVQAADWQLSATQRKYVESHSAELLATG